MKKRISKIIALGMVATVGLTSCQRDLTSLNEDPKHASVVPSENLVATALYQSSFYMDSPNIYNNNYRFFTQQWAETQYPKETRYDLVSGNQSRNHWNKMYVNSLNNLEQAKKNIPAEINTDVVKANKLATIELEEIFIWENLVDTYGNVPYFEALNTSASLHPKYDDAKTIYADLLKRIDAVISTITTTSPGYATGDLVYFGKMAQWKKFANSLKLRLAMNLADVDSALSKSAAESAIASGVMTSDADSYKLKYDGVTFINPVYNDLVASGRTDFIPSELAINTMTKNQDPRMAVWFTQVSGAYKGGVFGDLNDYSKSSQFSSFFKGSTTASNLLSYTEVAFLKAEAAARGYSVGGTATELYNTAVKASMAENGVTGTAVDTYLANNPYNATNWKQSIGVQAWVALFNKAFAAWNFTRRLDAPALVNPTTSKLSSVPYRMPYPDQEYVLNKENVSAAATAIGGDKAETKLFWDKY